MNRLNTLKSAKEIAVLVSGAHDEIEPESAAIVGRIRHAGQGLPCSGK